MTKHQPNVITVLRDMVPIRPLTVAESLRVAELQATRLLALEQLQQPPVPETIITKLPRIQVERTHLGDTSGATQWSHGRWLILLNENETARRQRFSLLHEFKHVLDNPFVDVVYPDAFGVTSAERRERVCDFFAAAVLMPRTWTKRAYCDDHIQDLRRLTDRFDVSAPAMRYRLNQIGLVDAGPRCGTPSLKETKHAYTHAS